MYHTIHPSHNSSIFSLTLMLTEDYHNCRHRSQSKKTHTFLFVCLQCYHLILIKNRDFTMTEGGKSEVQGEAWVRSMLSLPHQPAALVFMDGQRAAVSRSCVWDLYGCCFKIISFLKLFTPPTPPNVQTHTALSKYSNTAVVWYLQGNGGDIRVRQP
jgi:hypothetical protein